MALIAEIIGTIGGFGSSVFFVPIGNFYFDFHSVFGHRHGGRVGINVHGYDDAPSYHHCSPIQDCILCTSRRLVPDIRQPSGEFWRKLRHTID